MTRPTATGLIPVLATPFHDDGTLDAPSLARLVAFEERCGVDAVAVFGMASEGFTLTTDDRAEILATLRSVSPDMHVVAGVSAPGVGPALEQLEAIADGGARTAMVMPPHMVKPSPAQVVDFFGMVADRADSLGVSVMVQDAPGATGLEMSADTLSKVCVSDAVVSVKIESPPTLVKFEALWPVAELTGTLMIGGMNAQFVVDEYALGSVGTMPACEFSDLLVPVLDRLAAGDHARAREIYGRLLPLLVWGLQPGIAYAVHKEILVHRGIIESAAVRAPARPISDAMRLATIDVFDSVLSDVTEVAECSPVRA
ncbi:MAG: dihydrodipicolinate synthetase [Microbacterium sp.]|jgi:4-hydroxy-tetrahydrodipicolinate synthase|uniref:dihydrodipicolinate synthase family protein n=1 Tax=Microbacterium sp. TaxID=51671 RepID=UPI002609B50D|nr:dihydrodipicolinate synthase family protein [Microbacterium sp.]MDF2561874.1 dihydrodipicolinate synthetase [Microbacterium sp.]